MSRRLLPALLGVAIACVGVPPGPPPSRPVRILSINDITTVDTLPDGTGGIRRLSTMRRRVLDAGATFTVIAGDGLANAERRDAGAERISLLNMLGVDFATFGATDLRLEKDSLLARVAASRFRWLTANCAWRDGTKIAGTMPWDTVRAIRRPDQIPPPMVAPGLKPIGRPPPPPQELRRLYEQAKSKAPLVAMIGVTTSGRYNEATCGDANAAAKTATDEALAAGAELIVLLSHQPTGDDVALLRRDGRVDVILGGLTLAARDTAISGRHVLKADGDLRSVQFVTLWGDKGEWRQAARLLELRTDIPFDSTFGKAGPPPPF